MNTTLIRWVPALLLMFVPMTARADTVSSIVVVNKDGTTVESLVSDVSKVSFDTFDFTVLSKGGEAKKYEYDSVSRIDLNKSSGVNSLIQEDTRLAVWPTVTSSAINVTGTDASGKILIYDTNGLLMISVEPVDGVNTIDVSKLPSGHYILNAGKSSVRFIKK